jgi:hypothetical protein
MSQYTPAQLDALARQQGFNSYGEWAAFKKRQQMEQQQRQMQSAQPNLPPEEPTNWLQRLMGDYYPLASPAQKARKAMQGSRK